MIHENIVYTVSIANTVNNTHILSLLSLPLSAPVAGPSALSALKIVYALATAFLTQRFTFQPLQVPLPDLHP